MQVISFAYLSSIFLVFAGVPNTVNTEFRYVYSGVSVRAQKIK